MTFSESYGAGGQKSADIFNDIGVIQRDEHNKIDGRRTREEILFFLGNVLFVECSLHYVALP